MKNQAINIDSLVIDILNQNMPSIPTHLVENVYNKLHVMGHMEFNFNGAIPKTSLDNKGFIELKGNDEIFVTFGKNKIIRESKEKRFKELYEKLADEFIEGDEVSMCLSSTYGFRDALKAKGFFNFDNTACWRLNERSYIVNHGHGFKTRNTFIQGTRCVEMNDI